MKSPPKPVQKPRRNVYAPQQSQPLLPEQPTGGIQLVRTGVPLYRDVATAIERAIREGHWKPGDQIPTEPELEAQFGASRGTLRVAVGELVRKGLLLRQAGRGTFVLGPSFNSMERYFRYENPTGEPRLLHQNRLVERKLVKADARVAGALGVAPGSRVAFIRRLRTHKGEPFLIVDSFFPMDIWKMVGKADLEARRIYDSFRDKCGVYVVSADEYLHAGIVTDEQAALLCIPKGSAVIRLERIAHTFAGRPIEYRQAVGHGDRFHYHVRLE